MTQTLNKIDISIYTHIVYLFGEGRMPNALRPARRKLKKPLTMAAASITTQSPIIRQ